MENIFRIGIFVSLSFLLGMNPHGLIGQSDRNATISTPASVENDQSVRPGLSVSGMGWLTDRQLRRTLQLLLPSGNPDDPIQRQDIEDATFLLEGETNNRGFLSPSFHFVLSRSDGLPWHGTWQNGSFDTPLPPQSEKFQHMHIRIEKGILYHFEHLEIHGVDALPGDLHLFFHTTGFLFNTESNRYYSVGRKNSGIRSIITELNRAGYLDARLVEDSTIIDDTTGAVSMTLTFEQGPRYWIREITVDIHDDAPSFYETKIEEPTPYSNIYLQDYLQKLRVPYFSRGYPDIEVELAKREFDRDGDNIWVDLVIDVTPGEYVVTGDILFEGEGNTSKSFLRERVPLQEGEALNILAAETARQRIVGLGVFDSVTLHYPPRTSDRQDILYKVSTMPKYDVNLLAGYGSYEMVRGGIEMTHRNLLGRAQQGRLKLVQSMKSTRADYLYTIPEIWQDSGSLFARIRYLDRKEVSFRRQEFGGAVGTDYYWQPIGILSSLQYSYETIHSRNQRFLKAPGVSSALVGELQLTLSRDRLNNVLYPTQGYKTYVSYEHASKMLGGNVDFQGIDIGISYHTPLVWGLLFHGSVRHGMVWSSASTQNNLPTARRFFPGGENSIRGYTEGAAAPRDAEGNEIGAEVYLLFNLELEQPIMPDLSVVVFTDILGESPRYQDWPGNEWLTSVGIGLRYRTIIGPIRLEYGHNLNPPPGAPSGALQLSIGFPF
jgi:outer membrane protein insertion porin family